MKKTFFAFGSLLTLFLTLTVSSAAISPRIQNPLSPTKEKGNIAILLLDEGGGYALLFPNGEGIHFEKEESPVEWEPIRPILHGQVVAVEIEKRIVGSRIHKNFFLNFLEPTISQILESLTPPE